MRLKKWKARFIFIALLFMVPIVSGQLPFPNNTEPQKTEKIVYAATEPLKTVQPSHKVLLFYTHSHEAFKPIVKAESGMQAVYDPQHNIYSLSTAFEEHFAMQNIEATTMEVDIMAELKKQGGTFAGAYKAARPFVEQAIAKDYDLVLDVHRDSAGKETTTLQADTSYAKLAFVVGAGHANYRWNLAYAEGLHSILNGLVPGISRGVIQKSGAGVNGIYNQDLAPNMILVELGGIDNTEEEILRTISVLTQAVSMMLEGS